MTERLLLRALETYPMTRSHWPVHDSLGAGGCYLPPENRACHKRSFLLHIRCRYAVLDGNCASSGSAFLVVRSETAFF